MADDTELRSENERLKAENAALRREAAELKRRIADLESAVRKLGARLRMNSRNSSMPPSCDLARGRLAKRAKEPTGRKRGGQPGHEGVTREPFGAAEVDHVVDLEPAHCRDCHLPLQGEGELADAHQVVEVPPASAEVTEYRRYKRFCVCGAATTAALPEGVSPTCVGPRLQAVLTTLTGRYRMSRREAQEVVVSLYGPKAEVALGTIFALERRSSEALRPVWEEARSAVRQTSAANLDETSWREAKDKAWLWGAVTRVLSVFLIHRRRSAEAFHELMGEDYAGAIGTDRWTSYHAHAEAKRGFCWAHLKRDFEALKDLGHKGASRIGNAGLKAEAAVTKAYRRCLDGEIAHGSLRPMLQGERSRLDRVLRWGSSSTEPKAAALCRDLLKRYICLWTFTRREDLEPTNNRAERALRKAVLWRKGSFGSDSAEGSRFAERMLTVSESLRSQDRSVLDFVEQAIRANRTGTPHPSLLPINSS